LPVAEALLEVRKKGVDLVVLGSTAPRQNSVCRKDPKTTLAARAWRSSHNNFHVAAEQRQKLHEPFGGKTGKLPTQKPGDFRLIDL